MVDLITASLMVLPLVLCSDHNACPQHGSFCCGHGVHAKNRCWRWPLWFRPCPTLKQESPVDHGTDGAAARTAVVPLCSLFRWDTTMHLHCWSSAHMQLFYIIPISRHLEMFTPLEDEVLLYCLVTLINCPDWWRKLFGTWGWGGGGGSYRSVVGNWSAIVWKHGCALQRWCCYQHYITASLQSVTPTPPPVGAHHNKRECRLF